MGNEKKSHVKIGIVGHVNYSSKDITNAINKILNDPKNASKLTHLSQEFDVSSNHEIVKGDSDPTCSSPIIEELEQE